MQVLLENGADPNALEEFSDCKTVARKHNKSVDEGKLQRNFIS